MPNVANNQFAARMMAKPMPESLSTDSNARHFYDPPELIQQAFGGRRWFFETGCIRVHRVGLTGGLGWELDPALAKQCDDGMTGVRIKARKLRRDVPQLYDIEFVSRQFPDDPTGPVSERVVKHKTGLTVDQLKLVYAEILGDHVV